MSYRYVFHLPSHVTDFILHFLLAMDPMIIFFANALHQLVVNYTLPVFSARAKEVAFIQSLTPVTCISFWTFTMKTANFVYAGTAVEACRFLAFVDISLAQAPGKFWRALTHKSSEKIDASSIVSTRFQKRAFVNVLFT